MNSDWLTKECSFPVTRVQICDTSANYKWFLIGTNQYSRTVNTANVFKVKEKKLTVLLMMLLDNKEYKHVERKNWIC